MRKVDINIIIPPYFKQQARRHDRYNSQGGYKWIQCLIKKYNENDIGYSEDGKFEITYFDPSDSTHYVFIVIYIVNPKEIRLITAYILKGGKNMTKNVPKIIKLDVNYMYDGLADALSIYVIDSKQYEEGIKIDNNIHLHFDKDFNPIELEILDTSKIFDVDKNSLNKIDSIKGNIIISTEEITITCEISIPFRNDYKSEYINYVAFNDINAPPLNLELAKV
jgi:uncharacterized protein YuzE